MMSGIGSTIVQGMAFGAGSEVAHRVVGSMFGGGNKEQPIQQAPPPVQATPPSNVPTVCRDDYIAFTKCMKENNSSVSACDMYIQSLQACQSAHN